MKAKPLGALATVKSLLHFPRPDASGSTELGDFLKEFTDAKGVIEGHTDSVGDKALNIKLSQRRADSVRNYLVKTFGIAPERISAKGFGPTKPVADNKTSEGKLKNRRVEANFSCSGK